MAGYCNSSMFVFLYDQFFGALRMAGGYYQFQAPQLRVMPVKKPSERIDREVSDAVRRILVAKMRNPKADTSTLESEIDQLVYQLYGLTPEEIAVIEESVGTSP